jgi:hypothetical protein
VISDSDPREDQTAEGEKGENKSVLSKLAVIVTLPAVFCSDMSVMSMTPHDDT